MRLDFTTFQISDPTTATTTVAHTVFGLTDPAALGVEVNGRGRCDTDSFSVVVPGGSSPPVICGTNTGQHMYIDVPEECALLSFHLAAGSSATRQWNIEVTQFSCDYENLAPQGCTQYYYGTSGAGTVESYNFNAGNGLHLANQNQMVCVRREKNMCKICWTQGATDDFDLSMATADEMGHNGAVCGYGADGMGTMGFDYLVIPQPEKATGAAGLGSSKFCGRQLLLAMTMNTGATVTTADIASATATKTICSKSVPFGLRFLSDNGEQAADADSAGFKLSYTQESKCT